MYKAQGDSDRSEILPRHYLRLSKRSLHFRSKSVENTVQQKGDQSFRFLLLTICATKSAFVYKHENRTLDVIYHNANVEYPTGKDPLGR